MVIWLGSAWFRLNGFTAREKKTRVEQLLPYYHFDLLRLALSSHIPHRDFIPMGINGYLRNSLHFNLNGLNESSNFSYIGHQQECMGNDFGYFQART